MAKERNTRLIANNKKAYHDYFIEEKYEAGIVLVGTEVKSSCQDECGAKTTKLAITSLAAIFKGSQGLPLTRCVWLPKAYLAVRPGKMMDD